MKIAFLLLVMLLLFSSIVRAGEHRSSTVRRQFLARFGLTHTPPGCQIDHWRPLVCGGKDELQNLRLICGDYKIQKERVERKCSQLPAWIAAHPCAQNFCLRPVP